MARRKRREDGIPGHVIAAIAIVAVVIVLSVLRFVLFFDWDTKTGRLLTDLGHIDGPGRSIEDRINEGLFGLYGWDDVDEDQRAQAVKPEDSGIAGDSRHVYDSDEIFGSAGG